LFPIPLLGGAGGGLISATGIGANSYSAYTFPAVTAKFHTFAMSVIPGTATFYLALHKN
jgi:hypothetical protein